MKERLLILGKRREEIRRVRSASVVHRPPCKQPDSDHLRLRG